MAADLPDVFLLSVFRKLNIKDLLSARQVCTNWYHRVREANNAVRYLNIILGVRETMESIYAEQYIFGYIPCIKEQLMKEAKLENAVDQEKLEYATDMNTLYFSSYKNSKPLSTSVVQQIITFFPAVTHLNFLNYSGRVIQLKYLVKMLKSDWSQRLNTLRILVGNTLKESAPVIAQTSQRLFKAINRLPALKRLAIDVTNRDGNGLKLYDLPILARLKEVRFRHLKNEEIIVFLGYLNEHAANNADLQIDLPYGLQVFHSQMTSTDTTAPLLENHIRKQIVRINDSVYNFYDDLPSLRSACSTFPNLTSISLSCNYSDIDDVMLFYVLSQFPHLRHLKLRNDFRKDEDENEFFGINEFGENNENAENNENGENNEDAENNEEAGNNENEAQNQNRPSIPTARLLSVKALELDLLVTSHDDINWLNLPVTVPNVQAIHFIAYTCNLCPQNNNLKYDMIDTTSLKLEDVSQPCFGGVLDVLHRATSVPLERITLSVSFSSRAVSAKQLLAPQAQVVVAAEES